MTEATKTLLLVEDEAILAMNTTRQLQQHGYQVITAFSGEEALEKTRSLPAIDLVLMDINLGRGIDGTQAAQVILAERDLPVIFLSNHTAPEIVARTEKISSYGYVAKHSGETVLDASIRTAFKLYEARRQLAGQARLLQQVSDAIIATGLDHEIVSWNAAAARIYGYSAEEALGQVVDVLLQTEYAPLTQAQAQAGLRQTGAWQGEVRSRTKDGRWLYIDASVAWMRDAAGAISGGVMVNRDITQRKQAETCARVQHELAACLGATSDLQQAFACVCTAVCRLDPVDGSAIYRFDPESGSLELAAHHGLSPQFVQAAQRVAPELWARMQTGEPLVFNVMAEPQNFPDIVVEERLQAVVMLPVHYQGRLIASLHIASRQTGAFSDELRALFSAIAAQAGGALARIQAEEALRAKEAMYCAIFSQAPVGLVQFDRQGVLVDCNAELERIAGAPRMALLGLNLFEQIKDERVLAALQQALACGEGAFEGVYQWQLVDRLAQLRARFVCLCLPDGVFSTGLVLIEDVTEQKQAEAALLASEKRYRSLVEISPDPISLTDLQGRCLMANRAGLEQYGFESLEALQASGMTAYDFIVEEDRPLAIANAARVLETGQLHRLEYRARRRDGLVFPVEVSVTVISGEDGQPCAFLGVAHDISERRRVQEAQARALREKSTLLNDLQHRIKNSLALIASLVSLEQDQAQQPETQTVLAELQGRVHSLADLYAILYDSRDAQHLQLGPYLERIVYSLRQSFLSGKHGKMEVQLEERYAELTISARQATAFGLILNELLTNAVKYAFPGQRQGRVWVDLALVDGQVVMAVSNDGVPPPPDFEPWQAGGRLGLQIVRMLAAQLEGSVTYQAGQKTTFSVQVPYARAAAEN